MPCGIVKTVAFELSILPAEAEVLLFSAEQSVEGWAFKVPLEHDALIDAHIHALEDFALFAEGAEESRAFRLFLAADGGRGKGSNQEGPVEPVGPRPWSSRHFSRVYRILGATFGERPI